MSIPMKWVLGALAVAMAAAAGQPERQEAPKEASPAPSGQGITIRGESGGASISLSALTSSATRPAAVTPTEEQEAELLAWLKEKLPDRHDRLTALRQANPQRYQRDVRMLWLRRQALRNLPERVQIAHIVQQDAYLTIWRAVNAIRTSADPAEKAKAGEELRQQIAQLVDADQVIDEHRLVQLEEQIERLRAQLHQRAEQREMTVQERFDQYMRLTTMPLQPQSQDRQGADQTPHPTGGAPSTQPAEALQR